MTPLSAGQTILVQAMFLDMMQKEEQRQREVQEWQLGPGEKHGGEQQATQTYMHVARSLPPFWGLFASCDVEAIAIMACVCLAWAAFRFGELRICRKRRDPT